LRQLPKVEALRNELVLNLCANIKSEKLAAKLKKFQKLDQKLLVVVVVKKERRSSRRERQEHI
jgi:hypothetical protein